MTYLILIFIFMGAVWIMESDWLIDEEADRKRIADYHAAREMAQP